MDAVSLLRENSDSSGSLDIIFTTLTELTDMVEGVKTHLDIIEGRMTYQEYLDSERWQVCAEKVKDKAGKRCQLCNSVGRLHAHHRTYENIGCEHEGDVIALCETCHGTFHDRLPKPGKIKLRLGQSADAKEPIREAEQRLLGPMLFDQRAADETIGKFRPEDFYDEAHRTIFKVMTELGQDSISIDLIGVSERLSKYGELESVGGGRYLAELLDDVPAMCIKKRRLRTRQLRKKLLNKREAELINVKEPMADADGNQEVED